MEELFDGAEKKKKRSASQEKNDVLFEPLARFFFRTVGPDDAKRLMKVVRNLRAKKATAEQVNVAIAAWGVVFPYCSDGLTLESLNKHWDRLLNGAAPQKPTFVPGIPFENQSASVRAAYEMWKSWNQRNGT